MYYVIIRDYGLDYVLNFALCLLAGCFSFLFHLFLLYVMIVFFNLFHFILFLFRFHSLHFMPFHFLMWGRTTTLVRSKNLENLLLWLWNHLNTKSCHFEPCLWRKVVTAQMLGATRKHNWTHNFDQQESTTQPAIWTTRKHNATHNLDCQKNDSVCISFFGIFSANNFFYFFKKSFFLNDCGARPSQGPRRGGHV